MKPSEIALYRLASQQIRGSDIKTPEEMVRWFGAVQAQEYAQSKWGLGVRLPHLNDDDVEKDFEEGRILRTHLLRPTWHFVAAEDIRWMLRLTAPRVHAVNAHMYRKLALENKFLFRCHNILAKALEGGRQLTRNLVSNELRKKGIRADGLKLVYIMMHAELEGIICSGPRNGKQQTYMLLDERVKPSKQKTREESLAELANRYFSSRGPATLKDFSTWSGLTITECRQGLNSVSNGVEHKVIENVNYIYSDTILKNSVTRSVQEFHLLPIYDEYIMGYKNRDAILVSFNNIDPKPLISFDNTIIHNGQIAGTWKRTIKERSIELEYDLFIPANKTKNAQLEKAIQRFKDFTECQPHQPSLKSSKPPSRRSPRGKRLPGANS